MSFVVFREKFYHVSQQNDLHPKITNDQCIIRKNDIFMKYANLTIFHSFYGYTMFSFILSPICVKFETRITNVHHVRIMLARDFNVNGSSSII